MTAVSAQRGKILITSRENYGGKYRFKFARKNIQPALRYGVA